MNPVYYNDEEIEYDKEIDELVITGGIVKLSWEEKAKRAEAYSERLKGGKEVMIDLSTQKPEIDDWIANNKKKLEFVIS